MIQDFLARKDALGLAGAGHRPTKALARAALTMSPADLGGPGLRSRRCAGTSARRLPRWRKIDPVVTPGVTPKTTEICAYFAKSLI